MTREERLARITAHQKAWLAKMEELNAQGFRSGGYDFKTDSTALVKGEYPNAEIVGYLHRDLTVTWR